MKNSTRNRRRQPGGLRKVPHQGRTTPSKKQRRATAVLKYIESMPAPVQEHFTELVAYKGVLTVDQQAQMILVAEAGGQTAWDELPIQKQVERIVKLQGKLVSMGLPL